MISRAASRINTIAVLSFAATEQLDITTTSLVWCYKEYSATPTRVLITHSIPTRLSISTATQISSVIPATVSPIQTPEVTVLDLTTTTTIIGHRIQISLSKAQITGILVLVHREATALDLITTTTIGLRIQIFPIIGILKDRILSDKTILDRERITLARILGSASVERFRHIIPV